MAFICRLGLIAAVAILAVACTPLVLRLPWLLYVLPAWLIATIWRKARQGGLWSHGTARASGVPDLLYRGMLGDRGLILGRAGNLEPPPILEAMGMLLNPAVESRTAAYAFASALFKRWARDRMIRVNSYVHLLTCAPAGAGKTVYVLGPNLLSYPDSCAVIDPKGELAALSFAHRQRKYGHRCFALDPFGVLKGYGISSAGFNPLDTIDASKPDVLSRCKDLANMLVVRTGEEREPHWNDSAELILTSIILFVCACETDPRLRTLQTVRKIVSSPARFASALKAMQQVKGFWGLVAEHGRLCQWFVDRELGSVMATVQRHTEWMDDPQVAACLSHTTFDPRLLKTGRCTVYFVLPQDRLITFAPLMRVWIGSTLRAVAREGASEKNPILFLLDEAGNLGHMQALQDAVTVMRGYGIRLWFFFQSLNQVTETYGKHAQTILDNLGTQQFFGINSYETAEVISKRIGEYTITVHTKSGGRTRSWPTGPAPNGGPQPGSDSVNWGWSVAEHGRRWVKPEEILVLPQNVALIFHRNLPVIPSVLLRYYDAREFKNGGTGRQPGLWLATIAALIYATFLSGIPLGLAENVPPPQPTAPAWWTWQYRIGNSGGLAPAPQPAHPFEVARPGRFQTSPPLLGTPRRRAYRKGY
jgi:type IV secretion system protein VirD4